MPDLWIVPIIVMVRLGAGFLIGKWAVSMGRSFRIWLGLSLLAGVIPTSIVLAILGKARE